jgi:cytochrome c oxidase subunit IV
MSRKRSELTVYVVVYLALMLLLVLTVEAARRHLGAWNLTVTLLIAATKALLIALVFMHVRQSTPLVKLVAVASLLWLAIMFSLSLSDYWTRNWDQRIDGRSRSSSSTNDSSRPPAAKGSINGPHS